MKKSLLLLLMFMSVNLTQAREVTPPPVIFNEITDDALVITAIGEGTVTLYVQYIDMETGEMTTETYVGKGTVTHEIPRGDEDAYINYWATAQANADTDPGITAVEYFIEVPAKEETPVDPKPHNEGVWIVTRDMNGEECWWEMIPYNGDYNTHISLSRSLYGDPDETPLVQIYLYIYGMRYGATTPDRNLSYVNVYDNPLIKSNNYFVLENGYRYFIGVFPVLDGEYFYLYGVKLPLYNEEDPNGYIMGDADRDGKITIADVVTIIDYLLSGDTSEGEISQISKANADCDGNGKVTIADVTLLIDYLIKGNWY